MMQEPLQTDEIAEIVDRVIRESKKDENSERIPEFSSVAVSQDAMEFLPDEIGEIIGDTTVEARYPAEGQNPIARLFKTLISKITRCAVFPLANRLTDTNYALKVSAVRMAHEIESQKNEIEELSARIEFLEKTLERSDQLKHPKN